uniref:Uncharacterized protein n=1 Tax=Ditylenchus dipsaci TaxID=166011 RepID=A0A915DQ85_9BILA
MSSIIGEMLLSAVTEVCTENESFIWRGKISVSEKTAFEPQVLHRKESIISTVYYSNYSASTVPLETKFDAKIEQATGASTSIATKNDTSKAAEMGLGIDSINFFEIVKCNVGLKGNYTRTDGITDTELKNTSNLNPSSIPLYADCKVPKQVLSIGEILEEYVRLHKNDLRDVFLQGVKEGDNFVIPDVHEYEHSFFELDYFEAPITEKKPVLEKENSELKLQLEQQNKELEQYRKIDGQPGPSVSIKSASVVKDGIGATVVNDEKTSSLVQYSEEATVVSAEKASSAASDGNE